MDIINFINYLKYSFRNHKYLIFLPALVFSLIYIFIARDLFFDKKFLLTSNFKFNNQLSAYMDFNNVFVKMKEYQSLDFEVSEANYLSAFILNNLEKTKIIKEELNNLLLENKILDENFIKNEQNYIKSLEKKSLKTVNEFDNNSIIRDLAGNIQIYTSEESILIEFQSSLTKENSIIFYDNIKSALSNLLINQIEEHADYVINRIDDTRKSFLSIKEVILQKEINEINDQIQLVESIGNNLIDQNTSEGIFWNMEYLNTKIKILKNSKIEDMFTDYEAEKYATFDDDYKKINNMKKQLENYKLEKNNIINSFFYESFSFNTLNSHFVFYYLFVLIFISLILSFSVCFYIYKFKILKLSK